MSADAGPRRGTSGRGPADRRAARGVTALAVTSLALAACSTAPPPARTPDVVDAPRLVIATDGPAAPSTVAAAPGPPSEDRVEHDADLTRVACTAERQLRSRVSTESLFLDFQNDTPRARSIEWIDFDGRRVHYADLPPGAGYRQQTYVTHPWVIVDGDGGCRAVVVPGATGIHPVTLRAP